MKEGTKIVCINTGPFTVERIMKGHIIKPGVKFINENEVYTLMREGANHDYELEERAGTFYHEKRFVTLDEYRRLKINKVTQNINETR